MRYSLLAVVICCCGLFAQQPEKKVKTAEIGGERIPYVIALPGGVVKIDAESLPSITIKNAVEPSQEVGHPLQPVPIRVEMKSEGAWGWLIGEAGSGWVGTVFSFGVGVFSVWLLWRQYQLQEQLNALQRSQNERQDEFEGWQQRQAEIAAFLDVLHRVDTAESRWLGVKQTNGAPVMQFNEACSSMFYAVEAVCYALDCGWVREERMRDFLRSRYPGWKLDYTEHYLRGGRPQLPYIEKRIISVLES